MTPLFLGCAYLKGIRDRDNHILAEKSEKKAIEYEKLDDLQLALFHWHIIGSLKPKDIKVEKKILNLKAKIEKESKRHFNKGLVHYKQNYLEMAQKEFLITLRYQPDHKDALFYLKERFNANNYTKYAVKRGDTLSKIAKTFYGNPHLFFPIAYFNDLNPEDILMPGRVLKIINLEPMITEQLIYVEKELSVARTLLKKKNYQVALSVLEDILDYDPTNSKAESLRNTTYYRWGEMLYFKKEYLTSLKMLKRVDPGYKDVNELIFKVNQKLKKLADEHYRKGVKHFINEDLHRAIKEWEEALILYPAHQDAKKYINNTKRLLKKLDKIKDTN